LYSKILDENDDILKSGYNKKGVENIYLSSSTNKSISNFRETIPFNYSTGSTSHTSSNSHTSSTSEINGLAISGTF
jgi:hypothetical protein